MSSRIERQIESIEEYIENCQFQRFSNGTRIVVNKEELLEMLAELREVTPDEIKHYQRIIQNKEEILNEAKARAKKLIDDAAQQTTELVNEHEIMRQAYSRANEIVTMASDQAQEIIDSATIEVNEMRQAVVQYSDDLLAHIERIIKGTLAAATSNYEDIARNLGQFSEIIAGNRQELIPRDPMEEELDVFQMAPAENGETE